MRSGTLDVPGIAAFAAAVGTYRADLIGAGAVLALLVLAALAAPAATARADEIARGLITKVVEQVRAAAKWGYPLLWAVDGFRAYPKAILNVFRDPLYTGKVGRPRLVVWDDVHIVQVIKKRVGKRLLSITRRVAYGCLERAEELMQASQVLVGTINTAYIERLNATLRTWMPYLVRRTRTPSSSRERLEAALFWTGCVYNLCHMHATLDGTPAMAAALTDHVWSIEELIRYQCHRE